MRSREDVVADRRAWDTASGTDTDKNEDDRLLALILNLLVPCQECSGGMVGFFSRPRTDLVNLAARFGQIILPRRSVFGQIFKEIQGRY